jgi:ribonuclease P protein component
MLPKINRLSKRGDFERVRNEGEFRTFPFFLISYLDRKDSHPSRFGFVVSKKISTRAHVRNRVKRVLRECVRRNLRSAKQGFDFVIIAKASILRASNDTIESGLKEFIC